MARRLAGYATMVDPVDDIVCAYTTSPTQLPAGAGTTIVIGEFTVPTAVRCRLEAVGFVSAAGVTVEVSVYDPRQMSGSSIFISDRSATKRRSQPLDLVPDVVYQICARCVGSVATDHFCVIRTASIGAV